MKREILLDIAQKVGTPVYVYDAEIIQKQIQQLKQTFSKLPYTLHYAMKANENMAILKIMQSQGIGVDAVSTNEIKRALSVGFDKNKIIYTPSCPNLDELDFAFKNNIHTHIGAVEYFDYILKNYPNTAIGLRINPGNSIAGNPKIATAHQNSKFGIPINQIDKIKEYMSQGLIIDSLHLHTGSDVKTVDDLARSVDAIFDFARHFLHLKYLDLGSGFKVKYRTDDTEIDLQSYAQYIQKKLKNFPYPLQIKFEPGKYLISQAGVLLVNVNIVKQGYQKKFVGVDSGFHHLIRPMYYDAYHHIINLSNKQPATEKYDVVGVLCEEDTFAYNRVLSPTKPGDTIMIQNAGAYGFSMVSEYNLRDKPKEVLISQDTYQIIG